MKTFKIIIATVLGTVGLIALICGVYLAGLKAGKGEAAATEPAVSKATDSEPDNSEPAVTEPATADTATADTVTTDTATTDKQDDRDTDVATSKDTPEPEPFVFSLDDVPEYNGRAYVKINNNEPCFDERDLTTESFERYSELDKLGRCGSAYANLSKDTMPVGERGNISDIHPAGWHTDSYDFIDGGNLYNRCHLIAFSLSAENANERNLITGTRYLNATGMKPFEEGVVEYIEKTGNHVLYRVTPIYNGDELIARGVEMEALSVEDEGAEIRYHVFVYNVEPGVEIDYATGDNRLSESRDPDPDPDNIDKTEAGGKTENDPTADYVGNKNTLKFHYPTCDSVNEMNPKNRAYYYGVTRQDMINMGYEPCGNCRP